MQTPTIVGEKMLHEGKFLSLKQLKLAHPDGRISPYEVATRNSDKVFGIVSILPITVENEIIMIRQYRAPLDKVQLELPAGCAEVGKHATLEEAVHAELHEETGYASEDIIHVAEFSSSSGMTDETVHGYIAHNCQKVSDILTLDQNEYISRIIIPVPEFERYIFSEIARGNIIEPKMLAMVWWFRNTFAKRENTL